MPVPVQRHHHTGGTCSIGRAAAASRALRARASSGGTHSVLANVGAPLLRRLDRTVVVSDTRDRPLSLDVGRGANPGLRHFLSYAGATTWVATLRSQPAPDGETGADTPKRRTHRVRWCFAVSDHDRAPGPDP